MALIPRPQKNLILYTGVLAPRSRLRDRVRAYGHAEPRTRLSQRACLTSEEPSRRSEPEPATGRGSWARLMQRSFEIDVLACLACDGRMRLMALIEQRSVARRILRHLGMRDHPPPIAPAQHDDVHAA